MHNFAQSHAALSKWCILLPAAKSLLEWFSHSNRI